MSFFNSVFQGLKGGVGNNLDNNEDDVLNVKKELGRNGYYDLSQTPEPHGIITKAMDDGIRKYQKDNGLKIDGTLFPGGETETSLFKMRNPLNQPATYTGDTSAVEQRINKIMIEDLVKYDATGRMINPREAERRQRLKERDVFKPFELAAPKIKPLSLAQPMPKETQNKDIRINKKQEEDSLIAKATSKIFKITDLPISKKLFDHYISRNKSDVVLTAEEMEKIEIYNKKMSNNQKRIEDSITSGVIDKNPNITSPFKQQILNMKDGETIRLQNPKVKSASDEWDADISRHEALKSSPDIGLSVGSVKLKSIANELTATRKGNRIEITGNISHSIDNPYDFNKNEWYDDIYLKPYEKMAKQGEASAFRIKAVNNRSLKGTLELENGKITKYHFDWKKAD